MSIQTLKIIALMVGLMFLTSCGSGGVSEQGSIINNNVNAKPAPYIMATLISFQPGSYQGNIPNASVLVQDSSTNADITTAIVTINNNTLTYNPASGHKAYEGNVSVVPGGNVFLEVAVGGNSYSISTTQFSSYPTFSTPVTSTWYSSIPNTVQWTVGDQKANAVYNLAVLDAHDTNGDVIWPMTNDNTFQVMPMGNTGYSFLANSITAGDRLLLTAIVRGEPIQGASYNSKLIIAGCSTIPITVKNATLQSIAVTPANPTLPWGTFQQFKAIGNFSDNSSEDLSDKVYWAENGFSLDVVQDSRGLYKASYAGSATINASLNQTTGSSYVNVMRPKLLSIDISPINRTIVTETKQHFSAFGHYEDGYVGDITSSVYWNSENTDVAKIFNDSGNNGLATVVSTGTTSVSATLSGISSSTALTVTNRPSTVGQRLYLYLQSDTNDYVGGGKSYYFTQDNIQLHSSFNGRKISITPMNGQTQIGNGDFVVPDTLSQLQTGYYGNLTRYPFNDPAIGGMDWDMSSHGCNNLSGWFAIDNITYNSGIVTAIDFRFEQHCEMHSPAMYGWFHWVAP
ncbi:MAG: Ig-like domain-containing protein [Pelobacteraceae bacterium]